jgi:acetyltransferase-like isoleucine patch superfamily enzyme
MLTRLVCLLSSSLGEAVQALRRARLRLAGVEVGRGCRIGRQVVAGTGARLGDRVVLHDGVILAGQIRLGAGVTVQKMAELKGNVDVGDGATIAAYSFISTMPEGRIRIGRQTLVNVYSVIGAGQSVEIGDDCIFAAHINITDSSHAFEQRVDSPRHGPASSRPVAIGNGSWLGAGVKVLQGVKVGEGCVVGAGAVVNADLPDFAIAVGVPARVLRLRGEGAKARIS